MELNIINLHHFVAPIDKKGNVVQSMHMANQGDPVRIMTTILTQWLREDAKCSWKKLIECMKRCNMAHFAQEMEAALGLTLQGNSRLIIICHVHYRRSNLNCTWIDMPWQLKQHNSCFLHSWVCGMAATTRINSRHTVCSVYICIQDTLTDPLFLKYINGVLAH